MYCFFMWLRNQDRSHSSSCWEGERLVMCGCWWDPLVVLKGNMHVRAGVLQGLRGFLLVEDTKNEAFVEEQGRC